MIKHIHHIIPKHMGGTDDPDNLVEVSIETHAALHQQLWEDLGDEKDKIAWLALSKAINQKEIYTQLRSLGGQEANKSILWKRSQDAEYDKWFRSRVSEGQRKRHKSGRGFIPNTTGYIHTEETKKKMSAKASSTNNSQYGTCWVTNGKENKKIIKTELDFWVSLGYNKGRKMRTGT